MLYYNYVKNEVKMEGIMDKSFSESYKQAGVDVTAGYKYVELMKKSVRETYTKGVISDLGGFGGLFSIDVKDTSLPV